MSRLAAHHRITLRSLGVRSRWAVRLLEAALWVGGRTFQDAVNGTLDDTTDRRTERYAAPNRGR